MCKVIGFAQEILPCYNKSEENSFFNREGENMNIVVDTHSHTIASGHAYSSIREMAEAGKKAGLKMLAITDHTPSLPGGPHEFYFHNLRVIPRDYYALPLLIGAEVNITNVEGQVDLSPGLLKEMDIVIASIHGPTFGTDYCTDTYTHEKYTMEDYTDAYLGAMRNPFVHVIGHPDDSRYLPNYELLVQGAKETGTLLELNNTSLSPTTFRHNSRENILQMLDLCKEKEVMITTGTDSHVEAQVGKFAQVQEVLAYCNFPAELVASTNVELLLAWIAKKSENQECDSPKGMY